MILPDVNILIYAFRKDARDHHRLQGVVAFGGEQRIGLRNGAASAELLRTHIDSPEYLRSPQRTGRDPLLLPHALLPKIQPQPHVADVVICESDIERIPQSPEEVVRVTGGEMLLRTKG